MSGMTAGRFGVMCFRDATAEAHGEVLGWLQSPEKIGFSVVPKGHRDAWSTVSRKRADETAAILRDGNPGFSFETQLIPE
jgi:hypothetical protein